jgi:hypothetical protein
MRKHLISSNTMQCLMIWQRRNGRNQNRNAEQENMHHERSSTGQYIFYGRNFMKSKQRCYYQH